MARREGRVVVCFDKEWDVVVVVDVEGEVDVEGLGELRWRKGRVEDT